MSAFVRNASRFYYVVRPSLAKWELTFGEQGSRFLYDSREEAVQVACGAARLHWETRAQASGVRLEVDAHDPEVVATYGE